MSENDKPLVWIQGEVKTPPFSADARMKTQKTPQEVIDVCKKRLARYKQ